MFTLLLACTEPEPKPPSEREEPAENVGAAPEGAGPTEYTGDFFDDTTIHTVDITLSDDAHDALRRDPYEWTTGQVTVDGVAFPAIGVRLRGKIGSFRDLSGKPKWKLDFNRVVEGTSLGGYKTIALNNEVVDCSYLREPTGYAVFRAIGLPAPHTNYTWVTVDGEDYGLYVGVEYPDDDFLALRYADGTGNLYDGKYLYHGGYDYEMVDFTPELVENFTLEEGEDVGNADVRAIADAIVAEGTFAERLGPLVDMETFHKHVLAEQWIGQLDGYSLNTNNYRVYFDPADGKADLLVYDLDYAFYDASAWGMTWQSPAGRLLQACLADTECAAEHAATVDEVVASVDTEALLADVDRWTALIAEAAIEDPRRECRRGLVDDWQVDMRSWVENGSTALTTYWQ